MSITYTPTTNFGSKDNLPANDPNKVIVGGEFTFEFNAIQAAFALAAPTSNPTFTGTATFGTLNAGTTTVGTFTSTGIDDNATSTAITIDSSQNIGIGEAAPSGRLHVKTANSGASAPSGSGDDLVLEGSGNTGITIQTPNTSRGSVFFQDPQSTAAGYLQYDHSLNAMTLGSSGVARMTIDTNGNVGIGTTNPAYRLDARSTSPDVANIEHSDGATVNLRLTGTSGYSTITGSAGTIALGSNGTEHLRIGSSGDVGIGTITPASRLHVSPSSFGGNQGDVAITLGNETTSARGARINKSTDSPFELTVTAGLNPTTGSDLVFETRPGDETMRVTRDGFVGIGTTDPSWIATGTQDSQGVLSLGSADTSVVTGDVIGALSFVTVDPSFTATYSDGVGAQVAAVAETAVGGGYGLAFTTGVTTGLDRAERVRIRYNGNVGIGTTNPTYPLVVSNGNGGTEFEPGDTVCKMFTYNRTTSLYADNQMGGKDIIFTSGTTTNIERMRIDSSGNVGIGTDNPQTSLHITQTSDSSADGIRLSRSNELATYTQWVEGSTFNIGYANPSTADPSSAALTINSSGNVGIGADAPAKNLEVAGTAPTIRITDTQQKSWTKGDAIGQLEWYTEDQSASGARVAASIDIVASNTAVQPYADMVFSLSGLSTTEQPIMTLANTGNVGIGEIAPARTLHVGDAMRLEPTSTPASPSAGDLYFDSTTNKLRCYDGTLWQDCF